MSRNGSGTYTLPTGNPVVSGTLIEATWANSTLSDIASALTDSLSRSGQGGMTAAFRAFDGTSSVPGIAWGSETTTGWYRAGAGDMRLVVTGSEVIRYQSTGVAVTGTLSVSGNATVGGTLAITGAVTLTANPTLSAGTANGVAYLNGSKVLTTGSALTFDGSNLGLGVTPSAWGAGFRALQVQGASVWSTGSDASLTANAYYNGTNYLYINSNAASRVYHNTNGSIAWFQAPSGTAGNAISFTQAMTLDASGYLAVGNTSADAPLTVGPFGGSNGVAHVRHSGGHSFGVGVFIETTGGTDDPALSFKNYNGGSPTYYGITCTDDGSLAFRSGMNPAASFGTERARIDSSGNLLVGTTSAGGTGGISIRPNLGGAGTYGRIEINQNQNADGMSFRYNGTEVGRINIASTSTSYVTSSDYRLKEDIAPMTGALAKVAALKPCTYKWKADGSDGEGFIAHELAEVVPQCVTGEKDAVDSEGKPVYQGIDTSFLVATLTAAIQELKASLDEVKLEFDAYKAAHP